MKAVIVGAGDTGVAIAKMLSEEHHDVILIDRDGMALQNAAQDLDIATRIGKGTDWQLLEELTEITPDLFIALTESDETNLISCTIAKELGYPQTAARLRHWYYMGAARIDFSRLFAVDHPVSPELLAADEIFKDIVSLGSIRMESFSNGTVQLRTVVVPRHWKLSGKKLAQLDLPEGVMAGLICRRNEEHTKKGQVIFPHGQDHFLPGDEVTFIGRSEKMMELHEFFGVAEELGHSVFIIGGGLVGRNVAKRLASSDVHVRIVDQDRDVCALLAETLPRATVIHHNAANLNFLKGEKVDQADVVVIATGRDEVNSQLSLLVHEANAKHIIAIISDPDHADILRNLGIDHLVSPQTNAANRVMALIRPGSVLSTSSLYENRAKVLEVKVSLDSQIVGIPISELGPHLPEDFLFGVIQNRGRTIVARGDRILCPGDTVILFTHPKHMDEIFDLF